MMICGVSNSFILLIRFSILFGHFGILGFSVIGNNREYNFTESELQYMMDAVKSMKEGGRIMQEKDLEDRSKGELLTELSSSYNWRESYIKSLLRENCGVDIK